jgi:hypothetical protein
MSFLDLIINQEQLELIQREIEKLIDPAFKEIHLFSD